MQEVDFYLYDPLLKNGGVFYRGSRELNLGSNSRIPFFGWYKNSINRKEIDIKKIELKFKENID